MASVCRSTALRISAATTIDRATAVQISHCRTSSLTVFSTVWKMLRAAVDRIGGRRPAGRHHERLSESESRLSRTPSPRSSFNSIREEQENSANVTMPIVRATSSPAPGPPAHHGEGADPHRIGQGERQTTSRAVPDRAGSDGGGGRSISPAAGLLLADPTDSMDGIVMLTHDV